MERESNARARSYLIWLLARRDYSKKQLLEKLKKRGLSAQESQVLLDELAAQGWYHEGRFKKLRTRQLLRQGNGPRLIQAKLGRENLRLQPEELEEAYAEIATTPEEQLRALIEKFRKRYSTRPLKSWELEQKVLQALMRKGFSAAQIMSLLRPRS